MSLTAARHAVADALTAALPTLTVFDYWPQNVSAPCAVVGLGAGTQNKRRRWAAEWHVTLISSGDNTAAQQWLDETTITAAQALSETFTSPTGWDPPILATYAGQNHYTATLTIPLDLET